MIAEILAHLLQSAITLSLATVLVLLVRKPLRHVLGAHAAYAIWLLIPMAALAVLIPATTSDTVLPAVTSALVAIPHAMTAALAPASGTDTATIAIVLWLLGMCFAAAVFARRQASFNRHVLRRQHRPYDEVIGHGPAIAGVWRPRIILPIDFTLRYTDVEQTLVLAHEQVHLRRGDVHAQMIATALRCAFWFNPLLHFAVTRFRFDQELSCDAAVMKQFPASRRSYGDAMLKTQMAEFGLPVGCHWQSIHPLKERIAMLKKPLPGMLRQTSGFALVVAVILTGSYTAWAAQPATRQYDGNHSPAVPAKTDPSAAGELVPPSYPAGAAARGIGGRVVLRLLVGADGSVKTVKVESSKPSGVFDKVAAAAASTWKFHPGTSHGMAVEEWVRVPVDFAPDRNQKPATAG